MIKGFGIGFIIGLFGTWLMVTIAQNAHNNMETYIITEGQND
jgi:hypothetical protein